MCRLFGYVANRPTSVVQLLGRDAFDAFTSLTAVHGDGWGAAWRGTDDPVTHTAKSIESAADDPRYFELAERTLGLAGLVHLRWATGGLSVVPANTHPFSQNGFAFAHNGNIWPRTRLESLLSTSYRDRLKGDTDSERYFQFVIQCMDSSDDDVVGVLQAVSVLHEVFPDCSLNALLLTPNSLFAVHVNSDAASPTRALNELFAADGDDMPAGHATEYFAMSYRVEEDTVCVISSGLDEEGWTPMTPDSIVAIDLASREATRLSMR